jgi:metal-sulfur cluster biosynthetic enzyme
MTDPTSPNEGISPTEGAEQAGDVEELTFDAVLEAIRPVQDPEIGLSIVELGLIYGHEHDPQSGVLKVQMTLTSQMCPVGPEIMAGVRMMAGQLPGVLHVEVELVWTPQWDPKLHCSEDAKAVLGIWD